MTDDIDQYLDRDEAEGGTLEGDADATESLDDDDNTAQGDGGREFGRLTVRLAAAAGLSPFDVMGVDIPGLKGSKMRVSWRSAVRVCNAAMTRGDPFSYDSSAYEVALAFAKVFGEGAAAMKRGGGRDFLAESAVSPRRTRPPGRRR